MATDDGMERIKKELHSAVDDMRVAMTRVEILTAALAVFSRPVPEYEPAFRHLHRMTLDAHRLGPAEQ